MLQFILLLITPTSANVATTTAKTIPNTNIIVSFLCFLIVILNLLPYLYLQLFIPRFIPTPVITPNATTANVIIPNVIIIIILS